MKKFGAQDMISTLKKVLIKKPQEFMSKVDVKKWNYIFPLNQNLINQNYNDFFNIIKDSEIEIIELKLEDESEELCDSIFTHDPSLVLDDGAIILNMSKKLRQKETKAHKILYNSLNIPIVGRIVNKGTVEAGDCLWINNKTLLVGLSNRTNILGFNQLYNIVKKFNIKLIPIKLPIKNNTNSCFHLMSLISMLDKNLAIVSGKHLTPDLKIELNKNNIDLIIIPEDEYINSKTLAVNILALSPRNLIALNGYPKTVDLLIKYGCKVNLFSGKELCIKAEGGPTCLTRPILRN